MYDLDIIVGCVSTRLEWFWLFSEHTASLDVSLPSYNNVIPDIEIRITAQLFVYTPQKISKIKYKITSEMSKCVGGIKYD
jgi:hypothetical protein